VTARCTHEADVKPAGFMNHTNGVGARYLILAGITQPVLAAFNVQPQQRDIDTVGNPIVEQRFDLRVGGAALRAREHVGVDLRARVGGGSAVRGRAAAHLLHATGVSVLYSLRAIGIRAAEALVAANDGVAQVGAFEAGE
jgi:hypothetical protein